MSDALLDIAAPSGVMQFTLPAVVALGSPTAAAAAVVASAPAVSTGRPPAVPTARPPAPVVLAGHFFYDFYYRIWVIPETLTELNPLVGRPIQFGIWNAYPQPATNALESVLATGAGGLDLDFALGDVWKPIEYRIVHLTITPTAPLNIDASFEFEFEDGLGPFHFKATLAEFLGGPRGTAPDPPVIETWSWLTNVIEARDSGEQRIALRRTPRRSIKYGFMLESEDERRFQYNRWFKALGVPVNLPYYQYSTRITQASAPGDNKLWFDPAATDVREGELVAVALEDGSNSYLVKLGAVAADGAATAAPLAVATVPGMIVAPAFTSRLADRQGLSMQMVTGKMDVSAETISIRTSFTRPGSGAVIQTFDSLPVLHLRPISAGDTPEVFEANVEVVDNQTGAQDLFTSWPHPQVGTTRKWSIRRRQNPADMDWWRDFLDGLLGQREPFLLPTWFADLTLAAPPAPGSSALIITDPDYASRYFPFDTFKRLQLETEAGVVWRRVIGAVDNGDGTTTLTLNTALGPTAPEVDISKVSFLNLVRLADDSVTLTHDRLRTQIELAIRTVDL